MRILLWVCFIPLPLIMAYMLSNETRFKKNIVVGVTLPFEARSNTEVLKALRSYKKFSWIIAVLLVLSGSACMLGKSDWQALERLMVWVLPCILLPYIPYVICNKKLREIKLREGWGREEKESISIDTSVIPSEKWLNPLWFALALILTLLPVLWERDFIFMYIVDAVCVLVMWLIYRFGFRNKAERVDSNAEITTALSSIRKKNWGRMFLAVTYFIAVLSIIVSFTALNPVLLMAASLILSFLVVVFTFATEMKTRKAQEELCRNCGKESFIDDDDKWLWGIFYYNPEDEKLVINSRVGTNSTFNLAKPAGKVIAVLILLLLLAIPFIMPVTNALGNKPPEFSLSESSLEARSGGTEYVIKLQDIESTELMEELPEGLMKVSGTNFEDLLKGRFSAKAIGGISVILDPNAAPYLLITETDGDTFLLGSREEGEILRLYEKLK